MKRGILFSILFLCFLQSNFAQTIDTINFEINASRAEIDTSNQSNVWQIGKPSKLLFDSAYSPSKAIVTDTINFYPSNANASFKVGFNLFGAHPIISFRHKFDTDSVKDGGYIDVSFDDGQSWELLTAQTNHPADNGFLVPGTGYGVYTSNFYNTTDTLLNGQPAFSGQQNTWQYSTIEFPCLLLKAPFIFWVRFNFVSDSVQTNKEGWLIDNIIIDNTGECSAVNELQNNKITVSISPNPISNTSLVNIYNGDIKNGVFEVYDVTGKQVLCKRNIDSNSFRIERSNLSSGLYYYTIQSSGLVIGSGKFSVE